MNNIADSYVYNWTHLVQVWLYCKGYMTSLPFNAFCNYYYKYDDERKGYYLVRNIGDL